MGWKKLTGGAARAPMLLRLRVGMARRALSGLAVVCVALALVASGCGSSKSSSSASGTSSATTSTSSTHLAKTKFVLHAGLAFGAFHHFIYGPLRAGDFKHPLSHKVTITKAGLAAVFLVHELKLALADAKADPALSKVVAPLTALEAKIRGQAAAIKSGHPNSSAIQSANGSIASIHGLSSSAGQPITEQVPPSPSG